MTNGDARAVEVDRLCHTFGQGSTRQQVLFDATFSVARGEIMILSGPSGCGKTTILTLVGALRSVQSGSVRLFGRELAGAAKRSLVVARRQIGFIFQAHNLHRNLTALENVRMALEAREHDVRDADNRCRHSLASVGLDAYAGRYPAQLSIGQRQRVAIARALIGRPTLVLADEPTASLDSQAGRIVVDSLQHIARQQGTSVVLVTHDSRILDVADRRVSMEDGRLIPEAR